MIRAATLWTSTHPYEKQLHICMIQMPTSRIATHPFNASDGTTATSNAWIFDTACPHHMVHNHELFHDYNQFPTPIAVHGIGSGKYLAYGQGTSHIRSLHDGQASNEHNLEYV
jgi:Pol polyprotein, beta-barrel domain